MTMSSCARKRCIFYPCTALLMTDFHELLPCSQYGDFTTTTICNIVRPQLDSDPFTQYMTSQKWRPKSLFFNVSFVVNTEYALRAFLEPQTALFWWFKWNILLQKTVVDLFFCCHCPLNLVDERWHKAWTIRPIHSSHSCLTINNFNHRTTVGCYCFTSHFVSSASRESILRKTNRSVCLLQQEPCFRIDRIDSERRNQKTSYERILLQIRKTNIPLLRCVINLFLFFLLFFLPPTGSW